MSRKKNMRRPARVSPLENENSLTVVDAYASKNMRRPGLSKPCGFMPHLARQLMRKSVVRTRVTSSLQ